MQDLQVKRNIKFVRFERPTAWVVAAFVVEIQDGCEVAISDPKIVRVILKQNQFQCALNSGKILSLPPARNLLAVPNTLLISPYFFSFQHFNSDIIVWFLAQPPTFS